jgi:hypothetical protein
MRYRHQEVIGHGSQAGSTADGILTNKWLLFWAMVGVCLLFC